MAIEEFTASGTFTWPAGITTATVECWGGGGGGGISTSGEGSGGGGGYSIAEVTKSAATATVTVGAAGALNGAGGLSSFVQGGTTNCKAFGGGGAFARAGGGSSGLGTGDIRFAGGAGASSTGTNAGGAGGGSSGGLREAGMAGSANSGAVGGAGGHAPTAGGAGGAGGSNTVAGTSGSLYGGGGGGGGAGANAGSGYQGRVLVRWLTQSSAEMFAVGVCCPVLCDEPVIYMVDDINNPRHTRYPLIATLTMSGWGEGTTEPPGCCSDIDGSYILNLGYISSFGQGHGYPHYWGSEAIQSPAPPRYAVATTTPVDTLSGSLNYLACNDIGVVIAFGFAATAGHITVDWGGATRNEWSLSSQTYRRWTSDCYPTLGAGSPKVFVCPDQVTGTLVYISNYFCAAPTNVTIDFSDFVEYPLSGGHIKTHDP